MLGSSKYDLNDVWVRCKACVGVIGIRPDDAGAQFNEEMHCYAIVEELAKSGNYKCCGFPCTVAQINMARPEERSSIHR